MTIIIKTKMTEIPKTCKECELRVLAPNMIMCGYLKDWLEPFQYKKGKVKLDNCPLEVQK